MKRLMALVLAAMMIMVLGGCGNGAVSSEKYSEQNAQDDVTASPSNAAAQESAGVHNQSESDVFSKIVINAKPTLDGKVCVFITNESETVIDELSVQVNYKDAEGKIINLSEDGHDMVLPAYTVISKMDAPDEYADFEIITDIELGVHPKYINHSEDVAISANQGDDCVIVEITNNSSISIDEIEYVVILYKGEDIVFICYPRDVYDVDAGKTVIEKEETYSMDYDRFEVYLNQAHTFGL